MIFHNPVKGCNLNKFIMNFLQKLLFNISLLNSFDLSKLFFKGIIEFKLTLKDL